MIGLLIMLCCLPIIIMLAFFVMLSLLSILLLLIFCIGIALFFAPIALGILLKSFFLKK